MNKRGSTPSIPHLFIMTLLWILGILCGIICLAFGILPVLLGMGYLAVVDAIFQRFHAGKRIYYPVSLLQGFLGACFMVAALPLTLTEELYAPTAF